MLAGYIKPLYSIKDKEWTHWSYYYIFPWSLILDPNITINAHTSVHIIVTSWFRYNILALSSSMALYSKHWYTRHTLSFRSFLPVCISPISSGFLAGVQFRNCCVAIVTCLTYCTDVHSEVVRCISYNTTPLLPSEFVRSAQVELEVSAITGLPELQDKVCHVYL